MKWLSPPNREYVIIAAVVLTLALDFIWGAGYWLLLVSVIGGLPTLAGAVDSVRARKINIEAFNAFALVVSFITGEFRSAAFIVLMLAFARILGWYTESRAHAATQELLKLKPATALRETGDELQEIKSEDVRVGDIIIIKTGGRVPVDGTVVYGSALINESSVTGESLSVEKIIGDQVLSATLNESGVIKLRADKIGQDSTIERMVRLVEEASKNKSRSEKLADRFAGMFLPLVAVFGLVVYLVTRNTSMVAGIFLVACADDMAVAIPLAVAAALGNAAKHGVIVKGGEWLEVLSKTKTVVFDKTGTLTYGELKLSNIFITPGVKEKDFWQAVAAAEKFSEHPLGRVIFHEAVGRVGQVSDPTRVLVRKGSGIVATWAGVEVIIGNETIIADQGLAYPAELKNHPSSSAVVFLNKKFAGMFSVTDSVRPEARASIKALRQVGVERVLMFTGDNEQVASAIAGELGITEVRANMLPEQKLRALEELQKLGTVAMVGDGVNDAPALARADVGIAMGGGGAAIAVEAADIVILADDLSHLVQTVDLSRRTMSVIRGDTVIWVITNAVGFALVLAGIASPPWAAFYNFLSDFLPLFNSARLFRERYYLHDT